MKGFFGMKHKPVVHYICLYTDPGLCASIFREPAECAKIEYLTGALKAAGFRVELFSTRSTSVHGELVKPKTVMVDEDEVHRYLFSITGGRLVNRLNALLNALQTAAYVLLHVRAGEPVLLYHQYYYYGVFTFLKHIKRFTLVLEIEELHYTLMHCRKEQELRFIGLADKYLLIQPGLLRKVNTKGRPYLVFYGDYRLPQTTGAAFSDKRIGVVYAGVIESRRSAAFLACRAARYLDNRYRLHILGFGPQTEVQKLQALIEETNHICQDQRVVYHGEKSGEELSSFLNACRIGLSCHSYLPQDSLSSAYSFPSKITMYLSHNLWVVSPALKCVEDSPFRECVRFYRQDGTPEEPQRIAACIREISLKLTEGFSPAELMRQIKADFEKQLACFFGKTR